jgi:hypothetical protein
VFQIYVEFDSGPETGERELQEVVEILFDFFPEDSGLPGVEVGQLEGEILSVVHCVLFQEVLVVVDYVLF